MGTGCVQGLLGFGERQNRKTPEKRARACSRKAAVLCVPGLEDAHFALKTPLDPDVLVWVICYSSVTE